MEGQNLEIRQFLAKYEAVIEGQRQRIQDAGRRSLTARCRSDRSAWWQLTTIDDLWSDHLAAVAELRSGVHWYSWGGRDPLHEYLTRVDTMYRELEEGWMSKSPRAWKTRVAGARAGERGATWTYLTTDRPFGNYTERILKALVARLRK